MENQNQQTLHEMRAQYHQPQDNLQIYQNLP